MAHIVGYLAIGLFAFAGLVAAFGIVDAFIQLDKQENTNKNI